MKQKNEIQHDIQSMFKGEGVKANDKIVNRLTNYLVDNIKRERTTGNFRCWGCHRLALMNGTQKEGT